MPSGTKPKPATAQGTPPDPQIAVSSSYVVVGANTGLFVYTKAGKPYPSGNNYIDATQTLFQPLISGPANLIADGNGHIDNFNDLRVIFDPYRLRFWVVATGTYRTYICAQTTAACGNKGDKCSPSSTNSACVKGALTLSPSNRRMVIGLAVSIDENPMHGWYRYWWDVAVGWSTGKAPYQPGDLGDYPNLGINAVSVDVSVIVTGTTGTQRNGRDYPFVALYSAQDMAANKAAAGWWLYPLTNTERTVCMAGGLRNEDSTCPDSVVQPTLAHPDPGGSYLVARESPDKLTVWKVSDVLQPTQSVAVATVTPPKAWTGANSAPQQGSTTNTIAMSGTSPYKVVWRLFLYVVTGDADSTTKRAYIRVLRLWVSAFPTIPNPPDGGSLQFRIGPGSPNSFGWPAIEVNKSDNSVVVYTRSGPKLYAGVNYSAWILDQTSPEGARVLKQGEVTEPSPGVDANNNPLPMRWGDLAGASVDFVNGKEADGIWIVHEYAWNKSGTTSTSNYALWVGKIFGQAYPDLYLSGDLVRLSSHRIAPGGSLQLSAQLANGGDTRAPATQARAFLVSSGGAEEAIGSAHAPPLARGASRTVQMTVRIPPRTPAGRYRVRLIVNASDTAAEYSKQNNTVECACLVVTGS